MIKDLNTSKAIFSKCEYGLVYNLNNLAFVSWTTSTNSTMETSWCYANLIKICTLTMRQIDVKIPFSCVNLLIFVMGCRFGIKLFIDNNISVATTALWQPTCFWRVSNLTRRNLSFFSIVEQTTNFTWSFGVTKFVLQSFGEPIPKLIVAKEILQPMCLGKPHISHMIF